MRAQNLTVSLPYNGCRKSCPFCVSRMTGVVPTDLSMMLRNAAKVVTLARSAQVSSVMFTGKGEPLQSSDALTMLAPMFKEFPMELQTNGQELTNPDMVDFLANLGFNMIAVSVNQMSEYEAMRSVFVGISKTRMTLRLVFNLTDLLPADLKGIDDLVLLCSQVRARQLLLRNITIPTGTPKDNPTAKWIHEHVNPERYGKMVRAFLRKKPRLLRKLAHGDSVYEMNGISVCTNEYCIQDSAGEEDLRSLIFQEDGHVYTAWNSPASILF